jgi:acetyl-CoA C-acetyltransferase
MSQVEHYALGLRTGQKAGGIRLEDRLDRARATAGGRDHPIPGGMIETAENLRREYGIGRDEQDELAASSHRRAVAAIKNGLFADEIVPVAVPGRRGAEPTVVDTDEHPRADTTAETLARLRPIMGRIRRRPSPQATPAARTTAPRRAW